MKNLIKAFSLICILVVFLSCHKDQPSPPPVFTDYGNIGVQGGTVKTNDGASVEIPAGALTVSKNISITNVTKSDTVANSDCKIYDLEPDGLIFTDSITLTLPFDDTYLDKSSSEENYGIQVAVFQDTAWTKLKSKVDIANKKVIVKSLHFSYYAVLFRGKNGDYFTKNKNSAGNILYVPYYYQGIYEWCTLYSLSMIAKYANYNFKPSFFASMYNKTPNSLFSNKDYQSLNNKLNSLGITTEISFPTWYNAENLSGYILKQLDNGSPVFVGASNLNHDFVVVGHDNSSFYVNDPSGALIEKVNPDFTNNDIDKLAIVAVPYDKFLELLQSWLPLFGDKWTVVIKPISTPTKFYGTINFIPVPENNIGNPVFAVKDKNGSLVGVLTITGKGNPPNGYILNNQESNDNSFRGTDFIEIKPILSNSNTKVNLVANLHFKVDNNEVNGSPINLTIPKGNVYFLPQTVFKVQLAYLSTGEHILRVELESSTGNDYWEIPFKISTTFNGQPPSVPTYISPVDEASDVSISPTLTWDSSDPDGDPLTYEVYLGTNINSLPLVTSGLTTKSYPISELNNGATYFWKVVAKDNHSNSTTGPVWSFTTVSGSQTGTVTDIDGNVYNTVTIGTQVWMAENLKTIHYNNGDAINLVTANTWGSLTSGAYCWYNNDETTYKNTYGALYNWYPVVDSRKICPTGWHVPSDAEWKTLEMYLGLSQVQADATLWRGTDQGNKLKESSNVHWKTPSAGNNSSGFTALPGGGRGNTGQFFSNGDNGYWWSSTEGSSTTGWARYLFFDYTQIYRNQAYSGKIDGFSVRCVKGIATGGTIPTNGLVAYYQFNGNANDESGNSNNGTVNGATPTSDRNGNSNSAYSFNGTSNYITVQNSTSLQLTSSATFNVWVSVPSGLSYPAGGASPHIFSKGATYGDQWANYSLQLVSPDGTEGFESNSGGSNSYNLVQAASILGKNSWHMITIVYQSGQVKFYTDGTLTDTKTTSTSSFKVSTLPLYIGVRYPAAVSPLSVYTGGFAGKMDNIRIYNRVLTDQEITALFNE